jgi:hypothetical protein
VLSFVLVLVLISFVLVLVLVLVLSAGLPLGVPNTGELFPPCPGEAAGVPKGLTCWPNNPPAPGFNVFFFDLAGKKNMLTEGLNV